MAAPRVLLINPPIGDFATDVASLLRRSAFKPVRLGLETAKPGEDRVIERKASYEELVSAVAALRSAGHASPEIGVYLMSGLPGQTREEVDGGKGRAAAANRRLTTSSPRQRTRVELVWLAQPEPCHPVTASPSR